MPRHHWKYSEPGVVALPPGVPPPHPAIALRLRERMGGARRARRPRSQRFFALRCGINGFAKRTQGLWHAFLRDPGYHHRATLPAPLEPAHLLLDFLRLT